MTHTPEVLPEISSAVEACDRHLRENKTAVLEKAAEIRERYAKRGIHTLPWDGWPFRPLFLPKAFLATLAKRLHQGFDQLRLLLHQKRDDLEWLSEHLPLRPDLFAALDLDASLNDPSFVSLLRPDGFLYPDRFVLSEPNFGNGSLVSNAYSEILADFFLESPFRSLFGPSPETSLHRPFQTLLSLLRTFLPSSSTSSRPFVALLAHHWEHQVILSWEARVIHQVDLARQIMAEQGIDSQILHEDEISLDAEGKACVKDTGQRIDLIMQITIGTSFIDEPERLAPGGDITHLRGRMVGQAPLLKPIAAVLIDKGTMPLLASLPLWQEQDPHDFRVVIAPTSYPKPEDATHLRLQKDHYVLKKAFDGKDTHVGISTPGRRWVRVLQDALESKEYVVQEYSSLPRTILPVTRDGTDIEWIPVRVELSPFLIWGEYAGAIARYAPDGEGIIMSPPPPQMGFTIVCALD